MDYAGMAGPKKKVAPIKTRKAQMHLHWFSIALVTLEVNDLLVLNGNTPVYIYLQDKEEKTINTMSIAIVYYFIFYNEKF